LIVTVSALVRRHELSNDAWGNTFTSE